MCTRVADAAFPAAFMKRFLCLFYALFVYTWLCMYRVVALSQLYPESSVLAATLVHDAFSFMHDKWLLFQESADADADADANTAVILCLSFLSVRRSDGAWTGWPRPEPRGVGCGAAKRGGWWARGAGAEHDVQAAAARLGAGETVSSFVEEKKL